MGRYQPPGPDGILRLQGDVKDFRELVSEIGMLITYEATRDLPLTTCEVETPICKTTAPMLKGKRAMPSGAARRTISLMVVQPYSFMKPMAASALPPVGVPCRLAPAHLVKENAVSVALEAEDIARAGGLVTAQEGWPRR